VSRPSHSRNGALAELAQEAARFAAAPADANRPASTPMRPRHPLPVRVIGPEPTPPEAASADGPAGAPPGYVPVAVAPERGNTRPLVPVDGRLHMRMARPTLAALDTVAAAWRGEDPAGLRDLERATLVRVGVALALADIRLNGAHGAVGEAVRAALDPAVRHTDTPLPDLERWLRPRTELPPQAPDG
jgi:hypothetical protein